MAALVDTGVLLRVFDESAVSSLAIRKAFRKAIRQREELLVAVQNIAEFWNVATRPIANNGHGLLPSEAKGWLTLIERTCRVVSEDDRSYAIWKRLVEQYRVSGVAVHDARLVAVMLSAGVQRIVTLNERDFRRYASESISIFSPEAYLGLQI